MICYVHTCTLHVSTYIHALCMHHTSMSIYHAPTCRQLCTGILATCIMCRQAAQAVGGLRYEKRVVDSLYHFPVIVFNIWLVSVALKFATHTAHITTNGQFKNITVSHDIKYTKKLQTCCTLVFLQVRYTWQKVVYKWWLLGMMCKWYKNNSTHAVHEQ